MTIRIFSLVLILLLSNSLLANEREFQLDGNEIFIGKLKQEDADPAYERIKVIRSKYTDGIVKILYMYEIEETWCEDRGGYGRYGRYYGPYYSDERTEDKTNRTVRTGNRVNSGRGGFRGSGHGHGHGYGHGAPIPGGPDLGICHRWEDRPVTRNKVLTLNFTQLPPMEGDTNIEECFYISFLQKNTHNVSIRTNVNQCRNANRYWIERRGNTFIFFPRY
jgi:hypothetical protein